MELAEWDLSKWNKNPSSHMAVRNLVPYKDTCPHPRANSPGIHLFKLLRDDSAADGVVWHTDIVRALIVSAKGGMWAA